MSSETNKRKIKINSLELTGNLAKDPRLQENAAFITLAVYSGKDKDGKVRDATFVDISYFGNDCKKIKPLKKGDRINLIGRVSSFKDKSTGFMKMGITGLSCNLIPKKEEKAQEEQHQKNLEAQEAFTKELDNVMNVDPSKLEL